MVARLTPSIMRAGALAGDAGAAHRQAGTGQAGIGAGGAGRCAGAAGGAASRYGAITSALRSPALNRITGTPLACAQSLMSRRNLFPIGSNNPGTRSACPGDRGRNSPPRQESAAWRSRFYLGSWLPFLSGFLVAVSIWVPGCRFYLGSWLPFLSGFLVAVSIWVPGCRFYLGSWLPFLSGFLVAVSIWVPGCRFYLGSRIIILRRKPLTWGYVRDGLMISLDRGAFACQRKM